MDVDELIEAGCPQAPVQLRGLVGHAVDGVGVLLLGGRVERVELNALLGVDV